MHALGDTPARIRTPDDGDRGRCLPPEEDGEPHPPVGFPPECKPTSPGVVDNRSVPDGHPEIWWG